MAEPFMVTYPVRGPRKHYGGSDPTKRRKIAERNAIAVELEEFINSRIKAEIEKGGTFPYKQFIYGFMAHETRYDEETIREICFAIDGGSNGFTVVLPGRETDPSAAD